MLIIISTTLSLKLVDHLLGLILKNTTFYSSVVKETSRYVILRERAANQDLTLVPDKEYLKSTDSLEKNKFNLRTDNNGFIEGPAKNAYPPEIVFIGGSAVECIFVKDSNRYPYLVSTLLKTKDNKSINILNAGVSGNDMMHGLIVLIAKVIPLKPKYVVLMENVNDLTHLNKAGSYWNGPTSRLLIQNKNDSDSNKLLKSIKNLLFPNIWALIKLNYDTHLHQNATQDEWIDFRKTEGQYNFQDLNNQYKNTILTFIKTARQWGIQPIIMTQFNRIDQSDLFVRSLYNKVENATPYDSFASEYKNFNETIRKIARQENVLLIDLDKEIPHTNQYIYDSVHLNDYGSIEAAEIIAKTLSSNLNFKLDLNALKDLDIIKQKTLQDQSTSKAEGTNRKESHFD